MKLFRRKPKRVPASWIRVEAIVEGEPVAVHQLYAPTGSNHFCYKEIVMTVGEIEYPINIRLTVCPAKPYMEGYDHDQYMDSIESYKEK